MIGGRGRDDSKGWGEEWEGREREGEFIKFKSMTIILLIWKKQ
jgi:hypothetical protein